MPTKITDPGLLGKLNGSVAAKVTDPALLEKLHGDNYAHPDDIAPTAPGDVTTTDPAGHIVPVNPMAQGAPLKPAAPVSTSAPAAAAPDDWSQPTLVPLQHNRRTGAWRMGDSALTKSAADAVQLPQDVLNGKYADQLDPRNGPQALGPEVLGRTLNFATMAGGGSAMPRAATPVLRSLGGEAAAEMGIPLTRGQTLGSLPMLTKEEALRQGAGTTASNVMRNFDARQRDVISNVAGGIGDKLGTNSESMTDSVVSAIQNKVAFHKDQASALYGIAADGEAAIKPEMVQALPKVIDNSLNTAAVTVDPALTPTALAAMKIIGDAGELKGALTPTAGKGADGSPSEAVGVSLEGLEQVRKRLVNLGDGTNDADTRAIRAIKKAYDDWTQTAVDNMLVSGDDKALDALKQARGASREYLQITSPDAGDAAGAAVAKMQKGDATAEEVANWLYGADVAAPTLNAPKVAERVKGLVGADSPAWQAVRAAAWERLTKDMATGDMRSNTMVAKRIETFLNSKGTTLSQVLYSDDERSQMQQFATALKATVTPRDATNPSRTAFSLAGMLNGINRTLVGGVVTAMTGGNAAAGAGAMMSMPVFKSIGARSAAIKAVRGIAAPVARTEPVTLGSALGSAADMTYLGSGGRWAVNDNSGQTSVPAGGTLSLGDWVRQQNAVGRLAT